jgi:formylglycine-generating enzyme required for sulfatase activity
MPPPPKRQWGSWLGLAAVVGTMAAAYQFRGDVAEWAGTVPTPTGGVTAVTAAPAPSAVVADAGCADDMVLVKGAKFKMGAALNKGVLKAAYPPHAVEVGDVCMDRTEVTLAAYDKCVDGGGCSGASREAQWPRARRQSRSSWEKSKQRHSEQCNGGKVARRNHPVNCVTWKQAKAFCRWRKARLPTEAEWELAARGPSARTHPWGVEPPDAERMNGCGIECQRWHERAGLADEIEGVLYDVDDGYADTAPVGSFKSGATPDGLMDMSGNVSEWVAEAFQPYPSADAGAPPAADPARRVIRGAAFDNEILDVAVPALRRALPIEARTPNVGFRCAADPLSR